MPKNPHILNAASNLLGIALVIITGLHVSGISHRTLADEVASVAAVCLCASCVLSYSGLRNGSDDSRWEAWADRIFLTGLLCLTASVVVLAISAT